MFATKKKLKPELIEDQEIGSEANPENSADIQFGLDKFADELDVLVRGVPTRTNIAVFAPWGSGKSSLANLLKARLSKKAIGDSRKYRFGRFDAFKFAEDSLSRHFISSIADELIGGSKETRKKFREQLYSDEQKKEFTADEGTKKTVLLTALAIGAFILAVGVIVALVASWLSKDTFGDMLGRTGTALFIGWAPAVAALTILVNVVLFKYGVTTDVSKPTGKEQFADKFDELLGMIPADETIVVFIDELDRCSAKEVVATLETLKTFLDSERCIFIVAADRKVIERAIDVQARQQTPANVSDPYFSAASSYLDKIFQYQLSLPPIKPHGLTMFASHLVADRDGVWDELDDIVRDDVVSVVIPTHVINPRRAKVLLNNFALNYRLATRSWKPQMKGSPKKRAVEIAKLSTLKTEFPTFFDDMVRFDDLIDAVMKLEADDKTKIRNDDLDTVARAYANSSSSVSRIIVKDGDADATARTRTKIESEQGTQLLRYLHKTAQVQSPGSDLIYLEPVATGFQITDDLAQELEAGARDNAGLDFESSVLAVDVAAQDQALRFLATLVSRSRRMVGVELRNAMIYTLRFAQRMSEISPQTADFVAVRFSENEAVFRDLVARAAGDDVASVTSDAAAGALRIVKSATRSERRVLLVVQKSESSYEAPSTQRAISIWDELDQANQVKCAGSVALAAGAETLDLHADPLGAFREELAELAPSDSRKFFVYLSEMIEELESSEQSDDEPNSSEELRGAVIERSVASGLKSKHKQLGIQLATAVLHRKQPYGIAAIRSQLENLSPIADEDLAASALNALFRDPPSDWDAWLDAIDPDVFDSQEKIAPLSGCGRELFLRASSDPENVDDSVLASALPALRRLSVKAPARPDEGICAEAKALIENRPADENAVTANRAALDLTQTFTNAGLVDPDWLPEAAFAAATSWLRDEEDPNATDFIVRAASTIITSYGADVQRKTAGKLAVAYEQCGWIHMSESLLGPLRCSRQQMLDGGSRVDHAELSLATQVVSGRLSLWPEVAALWLEVTSPKPGEVWSLLSPVADTPLDEVLAKALLKRAEAFDASGKFTLVKDAIADLAQKPIDDSYFKAARLHQADDGKVVKAIAQSVKSSTEAEDFRNAFRLWQLSKPHTPRGTENLLDDVLYPLLALGETGVNLALQEFSVIADIPDDVRAEVGSAILDKAQPHQLESVKEAIRNAGWNEDKPWWKKWD